MITDPRPGMVRFKGSPNVFFMAICQDCQIALPFDTEAQRRRYMSEHQTNGHTIEFAVDIRPDPQIPFAFVTHETLQAQKWTTPWEAQRWSDQNPSLAQKTDSQVISMKSESPQDDPPKKLNARDRRRLRRKDKQRNDT